MKKTEFCMKEGEWVMWNIWYAVAWLIVLLVMLVIEIMTLGLTTIWFCGGALVAMIAAICKVPLVVQIILFVVVSAVLLLALRPWAMKYVNKRTQKTNVEGLIGKTARITSLVNNRMESGRAMMNGLEWTARAAEDDMIIPEGTIVEVVSVSGVKLIVKKMEEVKHDE